jgi:hypothetical protein
MCYRSLLEELIPDLTMEERVRATAICQRAAKPYERFVPLVRELQHSSAWMVHPLLSLKTIRLFFPQTFAGKTDCLEFAWIDLDDGQYYLTDWTDNGDNVLVLDRNSRPQYRTTKGDVSAIVCQVEQLVLQMSAKWISQKYDWRDSSPGD